MRKKNTKSREPHGPCCRGLKQRIASAKSKDEAAALLNEGGSYAWASPKTKRAWARATNHNR